MTPGGVARPTTKPRRHNEQSRITIRAGDKGKVSDAERGGVSMTLTSQGSSVGHFPWHPLGFPSVLLHSGLMTSIPSEPTPPAPMCYLHPIARATIQNTQQPHLKPSESFHWADVKTQNAGFAYPLPPPSLTLPGPQLPFRPHSPHSCPTWDLCTRCALCTWSHSCIAKEGLSPGTFPRRTGSHPKRKSHQTLEGPDPTPVGQQPRCRGELPSEEEAWAEQV